MFLLAAWQLWRKWEGTSHFAVAGRSEHPLLGRPTAGTVAGGGGMTMMPAASRPPLTTHPAFPSRRAEPPKAGASAPRPAAVVRIAQAQPPRIASPSAHSGRGNVPPGLPHSLPRATGPRAPLAGRPKGGGWKKGGVRPAHSGPHLAGPDSRANTLSEAQSHSAPHPCHPSRPPLLPVSTAAFSFNMRPCGRKWLQLHLPPLHPLSPSPTPRIAPCSALRLFSTAPPPPLNSPGVGGPTMAGG